MNLTDSLAFVARHGYVVLFCAVLVEQGAIPIPTVPLLLLIGALLRHGTLSFPVALLVGLCACIVADTVWFKVGQAKGGRILRLICRLSLEPDSCVRQTENVFSKYGMRSLLVSKFIPGLNAVAAPMAGSSGARWRTFAPYDAAGALLWLGAYMGAGYAFAPQIELVMTHALRMGRWLGVLVAVLVGAWLLWKYVQRRRAIRELSLARISREDLRELLLAGEDIMIVDLRPRLEWEDDPLPGTLRIATEDLVDRSHEIPRDRDIVLLCR